MGSLVGGRLWGRTELDMTEVTQQQCHNTEKELATHSDVLAWKIPWTEEPGRLWSIGLLGVGHD